MPRKAVIKNIFKNNFNRGDFLSAKIYSDTKADCACGGKFSGKRDMEEYIFPVCNSCEKFPPLFRIVAMIVDGDGLKERVTIRHNNDGERFTKWSMVAYSLDSVKSEIKNGIFDANKYKSKAKRVSYLFENFTQEYLDFHKKREIKKEITPSGYSNKIKNINHLLRYFSGIDISFFRNVHVEKFRANFDGSEAMLNHCLAELKTMLKHAHRFEYILNVPHIGEIKRSRKRLDTMSLEDGLKILSHVKEEVYRNIISILSEYPVRPGEVRSLRWNDLDFKKNTIRFDEHFSDEKLVKGRKSRKIGEKHGVLVLPMTTSSKVMFKSLVRSLDKDEYIFKGLRGDFVSSSALNRAWRNARSLAGFKPTEHAKFDLYEFKHAVLSDLNKKANGNLKTLENASGIDIKTLMDRYVYSDDNLVNYFH